MGARTEIDRSALNDRGEIMLRIALRVGWTARNTVGGAVYLSAPEPNQRVNVTLAAQLNDKKAHTVFEKIMRYGDQVQVAIVKSHGDLVGAANATLRKQRLTDLVVVQPFDPLIADVLYTHYPEFRTPESTAPVVPDRERPKVHPLRAATATREVQRETIGAGDNEPFIVSEKPWMARRGNDRDGEGARYYPSRTTIERKWSDGSTDYRCAKDDCDYSAPGPQSVARHWGMSKGHPNIGDDYQQTIIRGPAYEPGATRKASSLPTKLAREIEDALRGLDVDCANLEPADLAAALARAIGEMRAQERGEAPPSTPLTAEQKLERIRNIVDDGAIFAAMDREQELKEKLVLLEAENAAGITLMEEAREVLASFHEERESLQQGARRAMDLLVQRDADLASLRERYENLQSDWTALQELLARRRDD